MTELKPCPFCGERLILYKNIIWKHPSNECILAWLDSEYENIFFDNDDEDIKAWNRRVE